MNKLDLTDSELECIRHFLSQARECGYPSCNEPYYATIDGITSKIYEIIYPTQPDPWTIWENDYAD